MSQTLFSIYSYCSIGVKFFLALSYKVGQQLHKKPDDDSE